MTDFNPNTIIKARFIGGPAHGQVRQLPEPRPVWLFPVAVRPSLADTDTLTELASVKYVREVQPERDYDQFTGRIPLFVYRWAPEPQDDPDHG